MRKDWSYVYLKDCLILGNGKSRPLSHGDIPVYGGNGILEFCDSHNYANGTIIIGRVGAYCGSLYISNGKIWISDNALSAKTKAGYDLKFLYYFLSNINLNQYAEGAAHPLLTHSIIYSIEAVMPPLPEQRAIAPVLSSLDDKIDLLHRQNATLEAMAEALFKKWFVVEAKEEWEEKSLSAIANFINGLACQKFRPKNSTDKLPVLKIRELSSGISSDSEWATTDVPEHFIITHGDVIFSWSGSLIVKIWTGEKCILNQHLFKVVSNNYQKWFYYFWCKYYLKEFISIADSKSTTMGHIKRSDLDNAIVVIPPEIELAEMTELISPYFDKILDNEKQIRTLEKLRDTLLPKLMGGEVRVRF